MLFEAIASNGRLRVQFRSSNRDTGRVSLMQSCRLIRDAQDTITRAAEILGMRVEIELVRA
jgi:hypothetical protein